MWNFRICEFTIHKLRILMHKLFSYKLDVYWDWWYKILSLNFIYLIIYSILWKFLSMKKKFRYIPSGAKIAQLSYYLKKLLNHLIRNIHSVYNCNIRYYRPNIYIKYFTKLNLHLYAIMFSYCFIWWKILLSFISYFKMTLQAPL